MKLIKHILNDIFSEDIAILNTMTREKLQNLLCTKLGYKIITIDEDDEYLLKYKNIIFKTLNTQKIDTIMDGLYELLTSNQFATNFKFIVGFEKMLKILIIES